MESCFVDQWLARETIKEQHSPFDGFVGWRFGIGAYDGDGLVGVVIVGNPTAPTLQARGAWEVTRLCTWGHKNAASFLLGAAWKEAQRRGCAYLVSYTRHDETGTSYRAAGWREAAKVKGRPHTTGNRAQRWLPGTYQPSTEIVDRVRWEKGLAWMG